MIPPLVNMIQTDRYSSDIVLWELGENNNNNMFTGNNTMIDVQICVSWTLILSLPSFISTLSADTAYLNLKLYIQHVIIPPSTRHNTK